MTTETDILPAYSEGVLGDDLELYLMKAQDEVKAWRDQKNTDPGAMCSAAFAVAFLPHFFRKSFCRMHLASLQQYDKQATTDVLERRGSRFALAAPRGSAKSTIHTLLIPLMDILLKREKYIVIISATHKQARQRVASLQSELLNNEALRELFPEATKKGKPWSKSAFVANDVRVEAFGAGAEMRGISFGAMRPTKIILDDAEDSRSAFRAQRRDDLLQWYDEVVENLGDAYTNIEAVGTVLHRESLLSRLMGRVGYNSALYQAIEQFSPREDLWKQWMKMYTDLRNENREVDSRRFFDDNRDAMEQGTQVLWPEKENYLHLMEQMISRGRPAFYKEKQNQPLVGEDSIFEPYRWNFFEVSAEDHCLRGVSNPYVRQFAEPDINAPKVEELDAAAGDATPGGTSEAPRMEVEVEIRPGLHVKRDLQIFGFIDPAVGRNRGKGDYAAIATVGRDRDGYYYVLDLWMRRAPISEQVEQIYALHEQYNYTQFGYEANGFQEVLAEQMEAQRKRRTPQGRRWHLPLQKVTHSIRKNLRISAAEPLIAGGWIFFCTSMPHDFITQAEEFPRCRHDDGLDALAGCIDLAKRFDTRASGRGLKKVVRKPIRGPGHY